MWLCVQEGVGDPSSGDSGTLLRHAVRSISWCFVSHCICQKRPHLVLLRSVPLHTHTPVNRSSHISRNYNETDRYFQAISRHYDPITCYFLALFSHHINCLPTYISSVKLDIWFDKTKICRRFSFFYVTSTQRWSTLRSQPGSFHRSKPKGLWESPSPSLEPLSSSSHPISPVSRGFSSSAVVKKGLEICNLVFTATATATSALWHVHCKYYTMIHIPVL